MGREKTAKIMAKKWQPKIIVKARAMRKRERER